ncbi:ATP-binding protein [Acuticoccus sp. M5D2P5]|uniref:ATP-binding protein n=1 Tax=Acuticoccus kalidii TaxID=2910977 RepID=UPI001F38776D|nr:ATP-binding protein [Acuticoccus kalidii]MCF3933916.1 ATP-binding protein [Acuticoccus kalidii]
MRAPWRALPTLFLAGGAGVCLAILVDAPVLAAIAAGLVALAVPRPARAEADGAEIMSPLGADAQAVLDASPDACVILADDGTVLWANLAAREQLGISTFGSPFSFALRVPDLIRAVEKVGRTGLSERARWSEKVPTSRWYEAFVSTFKLAGGAPEGRKAIAVFIRDLTEQQRLDRMREDFVANASHELRTPLAALTGFIETLQGPARDDAKAREQFLGIMREQADRMKRLTDALLSLSRIEMRAHVRPTDIVDCAEMVRYAVEMTRSMASEYNVQLELALTEEPIKVRADSDELVQVVDNLIENAIKYGGDGGRVLISAAVETTPSGATAVISVQDFGRGIAPEHVPRLTERFYRVDVEESRARQGTGLGLAIVKHIVARHRGRLTVRSELGAGSTFAVRLPMANLES